MRTLGYSSRRVSPLDFVNGGTRTPTVGQSQTSFFRQTANRVLHRQAGSRAFGRHLRTEDTDPLSQPTIQPTKCDVSHDFRELWQSGLSCKLLKKHNVTLPRQRLR